MSLVITLVTGACYRLPPASPYQDQLPQRLSDTGLYAPGRVSVASGVRPYEPNYALWSDGSAKRRWIKLPDGSRIDVRDMDDWQFPVGTKLWKEFSQGGVRVETRLLQRVSEAEGGWAAAAYVWSLDQRDAVRMDQGMVDALGTPHDVPSARACAACHAGRASFVLGFSAVQLSRGARDAQDLTLDVLVAEGALSESTTSRVVPGDAQTQQALGYLHANCGHCHSASRPRTARSMRPPRGLDLFLTASSLAHVEDTPSHRTLRDYVDVEHPHESTLLSRMAKSGLVKRRMPPLASELPDQAGMELVARFIASLR
ncbi:MAG: hypothetical protein QM778_30440 [Myxococcales bacterium]